MKLQQMFACFPNTAWPGVVNVGSEDLSEQWPANKPHSLALGRAVSQSGPWLSAEESYPN